MAEGGFQAYFHLPKYARRDKLPAFMAQTGSQHHQLPPTFQNCSGIFPVYDHSICSNPEIIQSSTSYYNSDLSLSATACKAECSTKPRNSSMCGLGPIVNTSSSSSSSSSPSNYSDSHMQVLSSIPMNPSSIPVNISSYNYSTDDLPCASNEVIALKPESWHGTCQGLSLSLSSNHGDQQSAISIPLGIDVRRFCEPVVYTDKSFSWSSGYTLGTPTSIESSKNPSPRGVFTGYAAVLGASKFLKPAQQLLQELHLSVRGSDGQCLPDLSLMDPPEEFNPEGVGPIDNHFVGGGKKFSLLSMLEEVYRSYRHYYQQIQTVFTKLEGVGGLGITAPYANLALKTLTKHFRLVKIAINEQLQVTSRGWVSSLQTKEATNTLANGDNFPSSLRSVPCPGYLEPRPVWRPQRGLPERAVSVLRAWLFEHFLHPYPTDTDKLMLAKQTGLSRNQVSNWFINARVRLWKPMVEEIHSLETRQASRDTQPADKLSASKSSRNRVIEPPGGGEDPLNSGPLAGQPQPRIPTCGRVSLTLGLHQNNGLTSTEATFPVGSTQEVGHHVLDALPQGFVMADIESQNRLLGRNIIGGQLFG